MLHEYRIDKLLGEGGFGLTYLAFDETLHKHVAIKEYMPSDFAWREDGTTIVPKSAHSKDDFQWGLSTFLNEARTLARFEDKNIVRVHRCFEANGTAYMVMEYCEGGTLINWCKQQGTVSPKALENVLTPLMNSLQLLHEADVLHRDIKPDNMVLDAEGHLKYTFD